MGSSVYQNANNGLCQCKTNGKSKLGSLGWAALPFFVPNGQNNGGSVPWGDKTDTNCNYYHDSPSTGETCSYDFVLSRGKIAPDGYLRDVILVNGAYPGPLIECNWGDMIKVNVFNNISDVEEGTALHWHGFLQENTPWEDGVPGVTQCPIAPGKSLTYEFKADLYGTSWYHSHYSAQYSGGAEGPIVIHGPTEAKYDIDLGPIMLADWYHKSYFEVLEELLAPGGTGRVFSDNNLINGRNNFDCSTVAEGDDTPCISNAGISKFRFQSGKVHRLRLINSASDAVQRFTIDEHTFTVFANDFVPIKPYNTTVVTLGVGQRADVLVTATGSPKSAYWMRANITSCSLANQPFGVAAVYYEDADVTADPTSTPWDVADPGTCDNDALTLTEPKFKIALPEPDFTTTMEIHPFVNGSGIVLWSFNNKSARVDYNAPLLNDFIEKTITTFPESANVVDFTGNNSIRIIVQNDSPAAHPMHLHGHNFYILSEGTGKWDGTTIVRPENPMRRDVAMVQAQGYLVIQFDGHAGLWPFHCHIAWHASTGFLSTLLIDSDETLKMKLPAAWDQTCQEWDAFTSKVAPDQIDSGF